MIVSKYCDHVPLYRQSQIFARHGVTLNRSTLANWVGGAAWWLEPLRARLAEQVFASPKLFADDTTVPVLDPGRGRTRTGRLSLIALAAKHELFKPPPPPPKVGGVVVWPGLLDLKPGDDVFAHLAKASTSKREADDGGA